MRIEGAVALITGAERGLGRALAVTLARRGARLILSGLEQEPLDALRASIEATGSQARALRCDLRDRAQITALVERANAEFGEIDVLVNNAGITVGGDIRLISESDWDRVFDINLRGAVRVIDAVLPTMITRGRGYIVNIASAAGLVAPALWIPYAASKFALVGFSEGLRAALRARGIAVSVACPMWIQTDMLTSVRPQLVDAASRCGTSQPMARAWIQLMSRLRGHPMAPETAARRIIRGVERERFMIYTHRTTRLVVSARALAPNVFARLWQYANEIDERCRREAAAE